MEKHIRFGSVSVVLALCAATVVGSSGQTFTTLASFNGEDGFDPRFVLLVQGRDGNFYGTTEEGGSALDGAVFRIAPDGRLTTLHSFSGADGYHPYAGLVLTNAGNFYGTTKQGGKHYGTAFTITPGGALTTLYNFCSKARCADGSGPVAALVQADSGDLYGTTGAGGAYYGGTVFRITPGGTLTTLCSFGAESGPSGELTEATDGSFYGTTIAGGANFGGMAFKVTSSGELAIVYNFCGQPNCADGASPYGGVVQGADGNLYGTTNSYGAGGLNGGGTVFRMTPAGALTTLYSFCGEGNCADGEAPTSGLVLGTDGNFYGTTGNGGANGGGGTIFQITPSGALTTLYSFCSQPGCADGGNPYGGLVQGTDGDFYGTTGDGGASGEGTVFKLSMGLGPFAKTVPTAGKAGTAVTILGTHLTGATRVSFNGTPADFTVVQSSEIATTVPTGAATGVVEVVTPAGTLTSNVAFRVPRL